MVVITIAFLQLNFSLIPWYWYAIAAAATATGDERLIMD